MLFGQTPNELQEMLNELKIESKKILNEKTMVMFNIKVNLQLVAI